MDSNIPKKFQKFNKSFISQLKGDSSFGAFSYYCAFPKGVSFNGQDSKESVVLMLRKHPAVYLPQALIAFLLLLSPFILFAILNEVLDQSFMSLWFGISGLSILLAVTLVFDSYVKWYYTVSIITDNRIVDLDFTNVLNHKFAEAQLEKIEDVTHRPMGLFSSIFDFGNVYVQTAGTKPEFIFESVPRARDVQDVLIDLLELKQEGKI